VAFLIIFLRCLFYVGGVTLKDGVSEVAVKGRCVIRRNLWY